MKVKQILLYDGHPESPRFMYETSDGLRFTPEQWQLVKLMERLEKKIDARLPTPRRVG